MSSKTNKSIGISYSLKIGLYFCLMFAVSCFVFIKITTHFLENKFYERDFIELEKRLNELSATYTNPLQRKFYDQKLREVATKGGDLFVRIFDPKTADPTNSQFDDLSKFVIQNDSDIYRYYGDNWLVLARTLNAHEILQVGKKNVDYHDFISSFTSIFYTTVAISLLLVLTIGVIIIYRSLRPLRNVAGTVDQILETGNFRSRIEVHKKFGSLNEVSEILNTLLHRNEEVFSMMRNSLDNVAHDLRTPMTRMRGGIERSLINGDSDQQFEALQDCLEESDQILQILNTLMDVAEMESGALKLNYTEFDLKQVLQELIELYELVAEEKSVRLLVDFRDELLVKADRTRIKQVFANLIDNAIKYSDDSSTVWVVGELTQEDKVRISIQDSGVGISEEDVGKIFNRLYRADSSRTKRGLGLGLSMVDAIIQAHNGTITVESKLGEGSSFIVTL